MDEEIDHILQLIAAARSAWDRYNLQLALPPAGTAGFGQGHRWDAFNDGHLAPQVRRNPAAIGAAWNRLQDSLVELSDAAQRVRGRAALSAFTVPATAPDDRRVGSFSRAWQDPPSQASTWHEVPSAVGSGAEAAPAGLPNPQVAEPVPVG